MCRWQSARAKVFTSLTVADLKALNDLFISLADLLRSQLSYSREMFYFVEHRWHLLLMRTHSSSDTRGLQMGFDSTIAL